MQKPIFQKNWSGCWQVLISSIVSIDLQTLWLGAAHASLPASPKHTTWALEIRVEAYHKIQLFYEPEAGHQIKQRVKRTKNSRNMEFWEFEPRLPEAAASLTKSPATSPMP